MDKISFDESKHQYTLEGGGSGPSLVLPSVSQVLQRAGLYGYAKNNTMVGKMNKGTHLHKVTVLIDEKMVASTDLDEEDAGYAKAYERFVTDYQFVPIHIERKMYHPKYLYAGTPDRIGAINISGNQVKVLIDIKTGQPHPATALQLAAYKEMANAWGITIEDCFALYIQPDSDYKMVRLENFYDNWITFQSALRISQWKERYNLA